jgi:ribosomal protein S18 acetylase RimI-like enzyme
MTEFPVRIRSTLPADVTPVVALIRLSMGDEVDWLFGQEKNHPADNVLSALFHRKGNRVSHDVCWVAEQNGQVVGALLAYPGSRLRRLEFWTGLHLVRIFGLSAVIRLARRLPAYGNLAESEDDEFYLSNLAILPEWQGRGIGASLLKYADELARAAGLEKCSLMVTFDNPARRLYERTGYRIVRSWKSDHPMIAHGSGGFYRMVKVLNTSS